MEFQAVILCGKGHQLAPFSTDRRASGLPKGLLPVNNKPLVSYALDWCISGNFSKTTLVSCTEEKPQYKAFVDAYVQDQRGYPVDVVAIDAKTTGEAIASLNLSTDFIVVPCDFITDVNASTLIDAHRKRDDDNVLVSGVYYKNMLEQIDKKQLVADYIVHTPLHENPPTLLDSYNREQVTDKKSMELRMSLLWKYANTVVSTNLHRASIFLCSKRVIDILDKDIPDWRSRSWNKVIRDLARRSWRHHNKLETVTMRVLPSDATFIRANILSAYVEANRYVLKLGARTNATNPQKPKAEKEQKALVGADSTIGSETSLGEKSSVKRSVVGNNCTIGKKCRLTGCVVLDDVTIEDDVVLENCLIGPGASIHTKCKLTLCNVEGHYQVAKGTQAKNETLQKMTVGGEFSDSSAISESASESDSDDEDGSDWDEEDEEENEEDLAANNEFF